VGVSGPSALFRRGLLDGRVVAVLGAGPLGQAAASACAGLGAQLASLESPAEEQLSQAFAAGAPDSLVVDAAALFAAAPQDGLQPLRAAADAAWVAARAAGTTAMIEAEEGGKIILLAPAPAAGPHAGAVRDALENLARTLSIEWARHQIRITTIHPADATAPAEVGALVAYLVSEAGDYFSGCLFSLGEAGSGEA
jgi:NAD(P)-dependent dehydrogenase (short-subunit alcohol dehydrogenase family)